MRAPETRHSRWVQIHAGNRHPRRDGNQSGKQLEYCWCKSDLSTTIPPAVASAGTQDTDSLANCVSAGAGRRDRCVRTRQIERCVTPDFMTQKRTVKFVFLSRIMPHKNQTGMDSTQFSHRPLRRPMGDCYCCQQAGLRFTGAGSTFTLNASSEAWSPQEKSKEIAGRASRQVTEARQGKALENITLQS